MPTMTLLELHVLPLVATLALAGACSAEASAGEDDTAAPTAKGTARGSIQVEIAGLHNSDGAVQAYLYASDEGFPQGFSKAVAHATATGLAGDAASLGFFDLDPGEYAVFVFHDENDNGELDRSLLGFPQEGIGVSNLKLDKPQRPKWSKAKFEVHGPTTQQISLRYL